MYRNIIGFQTSKLRLEEFQASAEITKKERFEDLNQSFGHFNFLFLSEKNHISFMECMRT